MGGPDLWLAVENNDGRNSLRLTDMANNHGQYILNRLTATFERLRELEREVSLAHNRGYKLGFDTGHRCAGVNPETCPAHREPTTCPTCGQGIKYGHLLDEPMFTDSDKCGVCGQPKPLKPCPFCGGPAEMDLTDMFVGCRKCDLFLDSREKWNNRA